jgi:hypothetical protein
MQKAFTINFRLYMFSLNSVNLKSLHNLKLFRSTSHQLAVYSISKTKCQPDKPIAFNVDHICFGKTGKIEQQKARRHSSTANICECSFKLETTFYVNASLKLYCLAIIFIGFCLRLHFLKSLL